MERCRGDARTFLSRGAAALAAGLLVACGPARPPNVLLVTLDTTRPDHLGPYGYEAARTPQLDALAERSVVYENAYASSSWTLPSHASIMTGLRPFQHGAQNASDQPRLTGFVSPMRPLQGRFETLAERLRAAGYRTGAVIGGPVLRRDLGLDQGFEVYEDEFETVDQLRGGRRAEWVANRAIDLVEGWGDEPWFLFVNFFDPHAPYQPPEGAGPEPSPVEHPLAALGLLARARRGEPPRPVEELRPAVRESLGAMVSGYDAEIAYMDEHLGRLLDAVADSPGGDGALVVITADHGESFGEHYYVSHGAHLYEDNVRVPLVVRWPGERDAGARVAEPVENRRVFDWILEGAGLDSPDRDRDGPIEMELHRTGTSDRTFGDAPVVRAVYDPPWKLIEDSSGRVRLFDLSADPGELHDLSVARPAVRDRLAEELRASLEEHPPLYDPEVRASLSPNTEEALRALGYLE